MLHQFDALMQKLRQYGEERAFKRLKMHVLTRIRRAEASFQPFGHMFVASVFPAAFYREVRDHLQACKAGANVQARLQDSSEYVNRRFNLVGDESPTTCKLRAIFSDPEVLVALAAKFYLEPVGVAERLRIHKEFEYMFTAAGRMQNIHTDIPPKFLSLVFYIPQDELSEEEELRNATILYGKDLKPAYKARYRPNSVCVFAPHFYSYHGFATTVERDSLVIFYVDPDLLTQWRKATAGEEAPYEATRSLIEQKLKAHPLIEYGGDQSRIAVEKAECLINAPNGRIMA